MSGKLSIVTVIGLEGQRICLAFITLSYFTYDLHYFSDERVGNLVVVCADSSQIKAIKSQAELIVRVTWSNPPSHGARVVAAVLNNPALNTEWSVCYLSSILFALVHIISLLHCYSWSITANGRKLDLH